MPHMIDGEANNSIVAAPQLSLADLACVVREALAGLQAAFSNAVGHAIDAGRALIVAKERVRHGEWGKFLKNCDIGDRQAQRYMRLALLVEANPTSKSDLPGLSIEEAIKKLSPPNQALKSVEHQEARERRKPEREAPAKITHTDIIAAWIGASLDEKTKALDSIGMEPLLAAIPPGWLPQLEKLIGERRQSAAAIMVAELTPMSEDDLSVPEFLRREFPVPPKVLLPPAPILAPRLIRTMTTSLTPSPNARSSSSNIKQPSPKRLRTHSRH